jgi:hypothetical protein
MTPPDYKLKAKSVLHSEWGGNGVTLQVCSALVNPFATALTQADALGYARGREERGWRLKMLAQKYSQALGCAKWCASGEASCADTKRCDCGYASLARALTAEPAKEKP